MAHYFKKWVSKAVNLHTIPNKWSPRWNIVRRNVNSKPPGQFEANGQSPNSNTGKKGKLYRIKNLRKNWSWKAGAGWTILSVLDWWLLAAGGWLTWQGVFFRWTPVGLCLIGATQWHLNNKELHRQGLSRTASQWQMNIYCSLPLRLLSRCWGWLADCRVPIPLRPVVFGAYSTAFGVNLEEASCADFKDYRSLSEFFTRTLKEDVRSIDHKSCLVSPCDGRVLHFGLASNSQIEQVKGISYSIEAFLGPPNWSNKNHLSYVENIKHYTNEDTELYQCIIYLAPGDYHRFHSPTSWKPEIRRHFSGELLSVSPKIAKWMPGLFCLNERALYIGEWKHGFFSLTAVGATNVGSVQIYMDDKLKTNKWTGLEVGTHKRKDFDELKLTDNIHLKKGDLVGQFNMGSTIVLIFEAPKHFNFNLKTGQTIKMGEKLGCVSE